MKKICAFLYDFAFAVIGYPVGTLIVLGIWLLRKIGRITVVGMENARAAMKIHREENVAVFILSNHPVSWEVFLVPSIVCFPGLIFRPFRDFPWCTPKKVLLRIFFFPIFFLRAIPAERGHVKGIRRFMGKIAERLHVKRQNVAYFPEGGRTNSKKAEIIERNGKKMRRIKAGFKKIINDKTLCPSADPSNVVLLPVWVDFQNFSIVWSMSQKIKLTIGTPRRDGESLDSESLQEILFAL